MNIDSVPFTAIDWQAVAQTEHRAGPEGAGTAWWRTVQVGALRVRLVEYAPGYAADHWCAKGHVVHVLEGEIQTRLKDGRVFVTRAGQTWIAGDGDGEHRSSTRDGARLFIVD